MTKKKTSMTEEKDVGPSRPSKSKKKISMTVRRKDAGPSRPRRACQGHMDYFMMCTYGDYAYGSSDECSNTVEVEPISDVNYDHEDVVSWFGETNT